MSKIEILVTMLAMSVVSPVYAQSWNNPDVDVSTACKSLPTHSQLQSALALAQQQSNGGFGLNMWGTVVNRDGVVCAVAFTGSNRGSQWPGSRVISAQKANTANAFSLPTLALSTAALSFWMVPSNWATSAFWVSYCCEEMTFLVTRST